MSVCEHYFAKKEFFKLLANVKHIISDDLEIMVENMEENRSEGLNCHIVCRMKNKYEFVKKTIILNYIEDMFSRFGFYVGKIDMKFYFDILCIYKIKITLLKT